MAKRNPLIRTAPKMTGRGTGGHKSAGILDDYAIRKDIQTKSTTSEDINTTNLKVDHIAEKTGGHGVNVNNILYANAIGTGLDVLHSATIGNHLTVLNNLDVGGDADIAGEVAVGTGTSQEGLVLHGASTGGGPPGERGGFI